MSSVFILTWLYRCNFSNWFLHKLNEQSVFDRSTAYRAGFVYELDVETLDNLLNCLVRHQIREIQQRWQSRMTLIYILVTESYHSCSFMFFSWVISGGLLKSHRPRCSTSSSVCSCSKRIVLANAWPREIGTVTCQDDVRHGKYWEGPCFRSSLSMWE